MTTKSSIQKKLFIWDCNEQPTINKNFSYVYWNKINNIDEKSFSILEILESNSDQLKSEYLKLIYELGISKKRRISLIDLLKIRENLSFWWMSLLVEKSNWAKTPNISNTIKIMALNLIITQTKCKQIYIKSNKSDLIRSVKLLCDDHDIKLKVISNNSINFYLPAIKNFLLNTYFITKGFLWLLRESIFSIPFSLLSYSQNRILNSKLIFVSYLSSIELNDIKKNKFNSVFWGPLPEYLSEKRVPTTWLYLPSKRFKFYETFKTFKKINRSKNYSQEYLIISSFFSLKVFFRTTRDMFKILLKFSKVKKEIKNKSKFLWPLLENDVSKSFLGSDMVSSLFFLSLFESIKNISNEDSNITYLFENQPWEFGLISSFKSDRRTLTAFAHSTIRYWDLRYFNDYRCFEGDGHRAKPTPDNLAVNGINDKSLMKKFGFPSHKIRDVESLRYLYLNDLISNFKKPKNKNKMLLVLGDYLKSDTIFILSFLKLKKVRECLKDVDIVVKPHPACQIKFEDLKNIKNTKIQNSDLGNLILSSDVVLTANVSSSAVEAYSLGKKVITIRNMKNLDMSPLRGLDDVSFVSDEETLATSLNEALYNTQPLNHKKFFRLNPGMDSWIEILGIKT